MVGNAEPFAHIYLSAIRGRDSRSKSVKKTLQCLLRWNRRRQSDRCIQEAHLFLIAPFCRLAKLLSGSKQMGWLVGAVGIKSSAL
jgi:hypothetical protein